MKPSLTRVDLRRHLAAFDVIEMSVLQEHQGACCFDTRTQLLGDLCARSDVRAALASIPGVVTWAPTQWPAFWCEVRAADGSGFAGDCGTHAHIAGQLLTHFGVDHVRGRVAIQVSRHVQDHWRATWAQGRGDPKWIAEGLVHHEVLRIGERWWDPSEACWFTGPGDWLDCGLAVAVREHDGSWDVAASFWADA
jgi:hypothetical protein